MNTSFTIIAIVVAYLGMLLFIGWYCSRRIKSNEDFLLAGRGVGPIMLAGTLAATEIGGGSTLGVVEKAYGSWGLSALWYVTAMGVTCIVLAIFAAQLRESMVKTIPEYFRRRYDRSSGLFTAIIMLIPLVGLTAVQFIASGVVFSTVMGWDYTTSTIIFAIVVIMYSVMGGMWSVTLTDFVQMILIVVGIGIALPFGLDLVGGWGEVVAHTDPKRMSLTEGVGIPSIIGLVIMYTTSFVVGQEAVQRIYTARTKAVAVGGALLAAFIFLGFSFIPAVLGLICKTAVDKGIIDGAIITAKGTRYVLPVLAMNSMPQWVVGLLFAGIVSATMSSASGDLLGAGSIIANDIYRVYINPKADEKTLLRLVRGTVLVVGILGILIALANTKAIIDLLVFTFTFRAGGSFMPYLFGHFWPKASRAGAWASLLSGSLVVVLVDKTIPNFMGFKPLDFWGLDAIIVALGVSAVAYALCSILMPPKKPGVELVDEAAPPVSLH